METKRSGLTEQSPQGRGQSVQSTWLDAVPLNVELWEPPQALPLTSQTRTTKAAPWRDEQRVVLSIRRPDGSELVSVYAAAE